MQQSPKKIHLLPKVGSHYVPQLCPKSITHVSLKLQGSCQLAADQCSRIRIFRFFFRFKKTWLFTFFWNDSEKNVKSR